MAGGDGGTRETATETGRADVAGPALSLVTLGAGFVSLPDGSRAPLGAKSVALLAYLSLRPGRSATRDALTDLLWGRAAPDQGRASLRQELRRMRRTLGPTFDIAIDATGGSVALRPGAIEVDAAALEEAASRRDADGLAEIMRLMQGRFLSALAVPEPAFQDWAAMEASRFEGLALDGLLRQMLLDESAGRLDRAADAARALLRIDPLQEDVHASLLRILVAAGRDAIARAHLERCRELFREELDVEPEDAEAAFLAAMASRGESAAEAGGPAPGAAPVRSREDPFSLRPLIAVIPAERDAPDDRALAAETAALLSQSCWFRVRSCDALFAAGLDGETLLGTVDYLVSVALREDDAGAPAAVASAARRGDGAIVAHAALGPAAWDQTRLTTALARRIAAAMSSELLAREREAEAARRAPPDDDYRRLITRASLFYWKAAPEPLAESRALLFRAMDRHPEDCVALCQMAFSHLVEGSQGWTDKPRDAFFVGREFALRAVRAAPRETLAHYVLGCAASLMDGPEAGRPHLLRSLELSPWHAPSMGELARLSALEGQRRDAQDWVERAVSLCPADPRRPRWIGYLALADYAAGDPGTAIERLRETLLLQPDRNLARAVGAASLSELGRLDEARRLLPEGERPRTDAQVEALRLLHRFRRKSRSDEMIAALARLDEG